MKQLFLFPTLILLSMTFSSCEAKKQQSQPEESADTATVTVPVFNADSAYRYVKAQVDFGPRVPETPAHKACGDYLAEELNRFGATVVEQTAELQAFYGKVNARNIIGSYDVENPNRILLLAHWDSRAWSDHDSNPENWRKPVDGANDGASGVGVLLEIARQLQTQQPAVGIDILFVDAEDQGEPRWESNLRNSSQNYWCLGSQYWAANPHEAGYKARFGILLDMVGAPGATFPREAYSMQFAPHVVEKVWNEAQANGFGQHFVSKQSGYITDDHVPVNQVRGIPCIDIIQLTENGFGNYWHTQNDTMENIAPATLRAVGQTLLNIIYKEY
ncbi:MAG: M28 family peptidase [Prevotellaceae bacterium]|jgi:hypothetical protein|nr:M28 family peptidase [Prevotellaceae bacterium]